jgi:hypothetical protein
MEIDEEQKREEFLPHHRTGSESNMIVEQEQ